MGYAVMKQNGRSVQLTKFGSITPTRTDPVRRLEEIFRKTELLIKRTRPGAVVVERAFLGKNPRSFERLAEARAAIFIGAVRARRPVHQYTPAEVKQAVTRWGRASKSQIQRAVQEMFQLPRAPAPDAADAIALGLCHFLRHR